MFCDAQPQPGSSKLARTRLVGAIKSLKDPAEMFFGDPNSIVLNGNANILIAIEKRQFDPSGFRRVFYGIIYQVHKDLLNLVTVGPLLAGQGNTVSAVQRRESLIPGFLQIVLEHFNDSFIIFDYQYFSFGYSGSHATYVRAVLWGLNASRISLFILTLHQALPHIEQ